jgi:PTH1 family peptidyl-tRNA hydrolase
MPFYCIAGLGNPGPEYAATRHNVGFRVAERLAEDHGTHIRRSEFGALTATVMVGRTEVLVMKPQLYMNRSGRCVAAALAALDLDVSRLLVAYDDADLPLGRVRVRVGGGSGGHRGVQSILDELGSDGFARLRLGVGRPAEGQELADFVLENFAPGEAAALDLLIRRGIGAAETLIARGADVAMQAYNGLPPAAIE